MGLFLLEFSNLVVWREFFFAIIYKQLKQWLFAKVWPGSKGRSRHTMEKIGKGILAIIDNGKR